MCTFLKFFKPKTLTPAEKTAGKTLEPVDKLANGTFCYSAVFYSLAIVSAVAAGIAAGTDSPDNVKMFGGIAGGFGAFGLCLHIASGLIRKYCAEPSEENISLNAGNTSTSDYGTDSAISSLV